MSRLPMMVLPLTLAFAFTARAQQAQPASAPSAPAQPAAPAADAMTPRQTAEMRADILMARKEYPDAIILYKHLLETEPKNAVILNKVGIAYQQQGMSNKAEGFYKRAVKADKTYASALNNLGTVEYEKKKYRKAIRLYKQAIEYRSDLATLYSNLGYGYFQDKKYNEAMQAFQKALELDPEIFAHHGGFGSVVQQRSVADFGKFYFLVAKTYALAGDAEQCAHYLKMSRDEGYKDYTSARKDPAFTKVLNDPRIQEALEPPETGPLAADSRKTPKP